MHPGVQAGPVCNANFGSPLPAHKLVTVAAKVHIARRCLVHPQDVFHVLGSLQKKSGWFSTQHNLRCIETARVRPLKRAARQRAAGPA